jgi:hypothetical protein
LKKKIILTIQIYFALNNQNINISMILDICWSFREAEHMPESLAFLLLPKPLVAELVHCCCLSAKYGKLSTLTG